METLFTGATPHLVVEEITQCQYRPVQTLLFRTRRVRREKYFPQVLERLQLIIILYVGDIIVTANGRAIETHSDLVEVLSEGGRGSAGRQEMELTVVRGGEKVELGIVPGRRSPGYGHHGHHGKARRRRRP